MCAILKGTLAGKLAQLPQRMRQGRICSNRMRFNRRSDNHFTAILAQTMPTLFPHVVIETGCTTFNAVAGVDTVERRAAAS